MYYNQLSSIWNSGYIGDCDVSSLWPRSTSLLWVSNCPLFGRQTLWSHLSVNCIWRLINCGKMSRSFLKSQLLHFQNPAYHKSTTDLPCHLHITSVGITFVLVNLPRSASFLASLFHGGKLQGQALTAASVLGRPPPSCLFYMANIITGTRFLVDTGAEVNVIPPLLIDHVGHHDGLVLRAANDSTIDTFGTRSFTLDLGLEQKFQ